MRDVAAAAAPSAKSATKLGCAIHSAALDRGAAPTSEHVAVNVLRCDHHAAGRPVSSWTGRAGRGSRARASWTVRLSISLRAAGDGCPGNVIPKACLDLEQSVGMSSTIEARSAMSPGRRCDRQHHG
jgi:hypothetical protein